MIRALIGTDDRVIDIRPAGQEFPAPNAWRDAPDDVEIGWALDPATGEYSAPPTPPPLPMVPQVAANGIVRFTVASGVVATTADTVGFGAVTRLSAGRYRAFYGEGDPDLKNIPDCTIRDAADRRGRVSAKTGSYVEVRTVDQAGTAADVQELTIRTSGISQ